MIKSTVPGTYGDARTGLKTSIIETEIIEYKSTKNGRVYTLVNYLVNGLVKSVYGNPFEVELSNEQLDQLDNIVENMGVSFTKEVNGQTIELKANEREWAKLPYGLLVFVRTDLVLDENGSSTGKTVFLLDPENWELS